MRNLPAVMKDDIFGNKIKSLLHVRLYAGRDRFLFYRDILGVLCYAYDEIQKWKKNIRSREENTDG